MKYTTKKVYPPMVLRLKPMNHAVRANKERCPARGETYYIKGCNGSGKSTVPTILAQADIDAFVVTVNGKILLTVFPSFNLMAAGKYDTSKSKGVDSLSDTEEMELALTVADLPEFLQYDLIFEGIIPATILNTWIERLDNRPRRLVTLFIDTPCDVCIERVIGRNGGADFDQELVAQKWRRIKSHQNRHKELFPNVAHGMIRSQGYDIPAVIEMFLQRDFGDIE